MIIRSQDGTIYELGQTYQINKRPDAVEAVIFGYNDVDRYRKLYTGKEAHVEKVYNRVWEAIRDGATIIDLQEIAERVEHPEMAPRNIFTELRDILDRIELRQIEEYVNQQAKAEQGADRLPPITGSGVISLGAKVSKETSGEG